MKINKLLNSQAGTIIAIGLTVTVMSYLAAKKAKEAVADMGQSINPVNQDNIFYGGVNAVGEKLSGNENWTLGGWIYDVTH